jgi:hypothetical protein
MSSSRFVQRNCPRAHKLVSRAEAAAAAPVREEEPGVVVEDGVAAKLKRAHLSWAM